MKILVTGGAGFIGSRFVHHILDSHPEDRVTVLDKLTYAGSLDNLDGADGERLTFVRGDICDSSVVNELVRGHDATVNFAGETHVDRSIHDGAPFIRTHVDGTRILLEAICRIKGRYLHVSTDEVYGDVPATLEANEEARLRPSNPYAVTKAAGDMMVQAYHRTYRMDVLITRGSNTYGPRQFPEKLVPLFATNALKGLPLPLYGDGGQTRDWIHVSDHCRAIDIALRKGEPGEVYNIGGGQPTTNLRIAESILDALGLGYDLIRPVDDRPGHDRRYAMRCDRIQLLGWLPREQFEQGLRATIEWYRENERWWQSRRDPAFDSFYSLQYARRLEHLTT
jgi:dTDP-glucose 4,6-dehydratase